MADRKRSASKRSRWAELRYGVGKGDLFRANLDAILCIATVGYATGGDERAEAFVGDHGACRVSVEEAYLGQGCRPDKLRPLVVLGTGRHATPAGHATRKLVGEDALVFRYARTGSDIVETVDGNPGVDAFEILKHRRPIHHQITNDGEFR